MIHAGGLGDDGVALSRGAPKKDRDVFPRGPADCFIGQREAASSHDDRVEAMDAGKV
jgi:hypothetical protein